MKKILQIENLKKSYKDKIAVNNISFEVYQGEILCLLGPNGAGKTTTIQILTGALKNDGGEIRSAFTADESIHQQLVKYQARLGFVPQDLAIYEDLTAKQNVMFFASLYGLKKPALAESCHYALDFCGLSDQADKKVKTFSGGMKRRLNIACAIAHRPELLIMDEPTVGIDPQSRNYILESVKQLSQKGTTVIYTTHYMEEVEEIAGRIIILDEGKIITTGSKDELKKDIEGEQSYRIQVTEPQAVDLLPLYGIEGVINIKINNDLVEITTIKSIECLDHIITNFIKQDKKIINITTSTPNLETVFLNLTGKSLRN